MSLKLPRDIFGEKKINPNFFLQKMKKVTGTQPEGLFRKWENKTDTAGCQRVE